MHSHLSLCYLFLGITFLKNHFPSGCYFCQKSWVTSSTPCRWSCSLSFMGKRWFCMLVFDFFLRSRFQLPQTITLPVFPLFPHQMWDVHCTCWKLKDLYVERTCSFWNIDIFLFVIWVPVTTNLLLLKCYQDGLLPPPNHVISKLECPVTSAYEHIPLELKLLLQLFSTWYLWWASAEQPHGLQLALLYAITLWMLIWGRSQQCEKPYCMLCFADSLTPTPKLFFFFFLVS